MSKQRGYALVLGMLGSAVLLLWSTQLFFVGQKLNHAHSLRTALDTAAYSGAVVQSRALNALALLNRAYIGHQIATAHILTLASWAQFAQTQAQQVGRANPPAWLIGSFFGPNYASAYQSAQRVPKLQALQQILRNVHSRQQEFSANLYAHFIKDLEQQTQQVRNDLMHELLEENLGSEVPTEILKLTVYNDDWEQITEQFSVQQGVRWVRSLQSLYTFLNQRHRTVKGVTPVSKRCPHLRHQLRRLGDTHIDATGQWSAHDSLSFHALRSNRWIGCYYREYAMGWAWQPAQDAVFDSVYSEDAREGFGDLHFWRWVEQQDKWGFLSEGVNPLANSYAVRDQQRWASVPFRDLPQPIKTHYGFQLAARVQLEEEDFTAYSAAQSQFILPPKLSWQSRSQAHEQGWFPFWTAALMPYERG